MLRNSDRKFFIPQSNILVRDANNDQAKATVRLIRYAAREAEELKLAECHQLLLLCASLIRKNFNFSEEEVS